MTSGSETPEAHSPKLKESPAVAVTEKRSVTRTPTDQLLYLELGTGNGGIVLNVSEEGCGFLSIAPVWDDKPRFSFAIGGGRRIQGNGKVVWVDESKKLGGLRFVNPSRALREQVRAWLAEPKNPEVSQANAGRETRPGADCHREPDAVATMESDSAGESKLAAPQADSQPEKPAFAPAETDLASAGIASGALDSARATEAVAASLGGDLRTHSGDSAGALRGCAVEPLSDSPAKQRRKQLRQEARARLQNEPSTSEELKSAQAQKAVQCAPEIHFTSAPGIREKAELLRTYLQRGGWKTAVAFALACGLALSAVYREQAGKALMRIGTSLAGRPPEKAQSSEAQSVVAEPARPEAKEAAGVASGNEGSGSDRTPTTDAPSSAQNPGETLAAGDEKSKAAQFVAAEQSTRTQSATEQLKTVESKAEPNTLAQPTSAIPVATPAPKQAPAATIPEPKKKGPHVTPEQVRALWSEVEAGDVSAEVHLGELYARGNGVPKSCGQARMLLNSAAKKGSDEAKQKLDELAAAGCP